MKVLFFTHPESDYGAGMLFEGMCELLGPENVYAFPKKLSYHGIVHEYPRPWEGGAMGTTCPLPWMSAWPIAFGDPSYAGADAEVQSMLQNKEIDFVIVESPRPESVGAFTRFGNLIHDSNIPVVLHDGEDYPGINMRAFKAVRPAVFLKREQTQGPYARNGTYYEGFPFSAPLPAILRAIGTADASSEFDHLVTFMCGSTYPERQRVADVLRDAYGDDALVVIVPDKRNEGKVLLPWEDYVRTMHRSLLSVNVRGYGYDTVRFWESATTSLLVSDPLPLIYANQYHDRQTIRMFTDHTNIVQVLNELLADRAELMALRARCIAHTRAFHTTKARATYLVDLMKSRGLIP